MAKKKIIMTEGKRNIIIASLLQEYDIRTAEDIRGIKRFAGRNKPKDAGSPAG